MSQIKSNKFLELSLKQIPRLLGQLNRNYSSKTYGSFDRAYWHYRTNNISSARYQEGIYTLTLLYCCDFENNEYYHDEKLLEWIRASLRFTTSLQRKNGSFDEWYLNEGSYVATAFLTAALSETLLLLREDEVIVPEESIVVDLLENAAQFLISTHESTVMNQVSGALFAIAVVGHISNKEEFITFAKNAIKEFISHQNKEGWWSEYGGPDIGYLTLTISYLEKYHKITGDNEISIAVGKAKKFVEQFINPDHTAGGEYMSRNTEYIIPSTALPYIGAITPSHLDDRYLCYILYNWIQTGLVTSPKNIAISVGEIYLPKSSLLRVVNKNFFLVANGNKGGSFRLYRGGKSYYDSGLEIDKMGKNLSTGILDLNNKVDFEKGCLRVQGFAKTIKEPLLGTKTSIVFNLWQVLFGWSGVLQTQIKSLLRKRMISYSKNSNVSFKRVITYEGKIVVVTDSVLGVSSRDTIVLGMKSAYNAVPSSKYAIQKKIRDDMLTPFVEERKENGTFIIKRTFSF